MHQDSYNNTNEEASPPPVESVIVRGNEPVPATETPQPGEVLHLAQCFYHIDAADSRRYVTMQKMDAEAVRVRRHIDKLCLRIASHWGFERAWIDFLRSQNPVNEPITLLDGSFRTRDRSSIVFPFVVDNVQSTVFEEVD